MLDSKAQADRTLRTADWYKSATRWTQLTLAEDDPVRAWFQRCLDLHDGLGARVAAA